MKKTELSQKIIHWIKVLSESDRVAVLVNGQPGEFFSVSRGLKQGDPLSPSLFARVEEVLSRNLLRLI